MKNSEKLELNGKGWLLLSFSSSLCMQLPIGLAGLY
jgi:hypothetical protein